MKLNEYDKPRKVLLNNKRKSHVDKFNEKVNKMMNTYNLKKHISKLSNTTNEHIHNEIDALFAKILKSARKAVEGPTRSLPFSQRKLQISNEYLY